MTNSIKRMKKNTKRNAISQELQDLTDDRFYLLLNFNICFLLTKPQS